MKKRWFTIMTVTLLIAVTEVENLITQYGKTYK